MQELIDSAFAVARAGLAGAEVLQATPLMVTLADDVLQLSIDDLVPAATPADQRLELALQALTRAESAARAFAVVATAHVAGQRSDAVEIWAEHREGVALTILQPFKRTLIGGVVEFGEVSAYAADRRIWR